MQIAPLPVNEKERLKALNEYQILDSLPEAEFDDITHLAADVCQAPIALISLIDSDRQWFKSKLGIIASETSRDISFCAHAISTPYDIFIVPDASKDDRFFDNPLVTGEPNILFYAGVPLISPSGHALGTLCVSDSQPRELNKIQINTLRSLARLLVAQMEQRKNNLVLKSSVEELKNSCSDLESFAAIAAHDLKSPLNNIITITHLLDEDHSPKLDEEGKEYITFLRDTANQMSALVVGILNYSRSTASITDHKEKINVGEIIDEAKALLKIPENAVISFDNKDIEVYTSRVALKQILLNLMDNAIKYNDKDQLSVEILIEENKDCYTFEVRDNGPGISANDQKIIFDLFTILKNNGKETKGTGIGLAIAKRLVQKLKGKITVKSEPGQGTSFIFTIPR